MKNVPILSVALYILSITALSLTAAGYPVIACILCIATFFVGAGEYKKYTGPLQVVSLYFVAIVYGIAIESMRIGFPFLGLAVILSAIVLNVRSSLIKILAYSRFLWLEPLIAGITLSFYLYGNLTQSSGWQGWVFPLPMVLVALFMGAGIVKDGTNFRSHLKAGYKAEIGKSAPEFSLSDQEGKNVSLSDFKNKRDVLLIFVRGDWCPACHIMLRTYEKERERFQKKNIVVMAIGPDPVGVNQNMVKRLGLEYRVLSDEGRHACSKYGVQPSAGPDGNHAAESPLPASFLIDKSGIVRYTSRPDRVGEFLNPSTIFPILESFSA